MNDLKDLSGGLEANLVGQYEPLALFPIVICGHSKLGRRDHVISMPWMGNERRKGTKVVANEDVSNMPHGAALRLSRVAPVSLPEVELQDFVRRFAAMREWSEVTNENLFGRQFEVGYIVTAQPLPLAHSQAA